MGMCKQASLEAITDLADSHGESEGTCSESFDPEWENVFVRLGDSKWVLVEPLDSILIWKGAIAP